MNKLFFTLLFGGCVFGVLQAQPLPCATPAEMTSFCDQACIICDINGFQGINDSDVPGLAPADFCTNTQHNIQWIAFMAGSTNLTLNVAVSNCQSNEGLEVAIYLSTDCETFQMVSNCDTGIPGNSSQNFTNTVPLIIGQYCYFVMDGNAGDICNYEITVVTGNTLVSPLSSSGIISGQLDLCPGLTREYTTTSQAGATMYDWTLDGVPVGNTQDIDLTLTNVGTHQLCVVASNVCDMAPPSCTTLVVTPVQPTIINEAMCEGDTVFAAGDTIVTPGTYEYTYQSVLGCDSLVTVNVVGLPASSTAFSLDMCDGDTLFVADLPFTAAGNYQETLPNWVGCDSIISFDLALITCEININEAVTNAVCYGEDNGSLSFFITVGIPPFAYSWQKLGSTLTGNGTIPNLNQPITIPDLTAGTYVVTVSNAFGEDAVAIMTISQPPQLSIAFEPTLFGGGFEVSCAGASDASVAAILSGGVPNYTIEWSNGTSDALLQNIAAGTYTVTLTDAANCSLTSSYVIIQPMPLTFEPQYNNATCDGLATGSVLITGASGGVLPYQYSFEGSVFSDSTAYTNLLPDTYTVAVIDSNGCIVADSATLTAPIIPTVYLPDSLTIDLADSIQISTLATGIDSLFWVGDNLSCYDCLNPIASPVWSGNYTLAVTSIDGCVAIDTTYITVNKVRKVFIPNVFTNNDDGNNDWFTIFAGPQVRIIKEFKIYDRWGELLFENFNFEPNEETLGWDGSFRGKKLVTDVYVYYAIIEFIDGIVIRYEGDVSIIQ